MYLSWNLKYLIKRNNTLELFVIILYCLLFSQLVKPIEFNKFQKAVPPRIARPKANPKNGKVFSVLPYLVVGIVDPKKCQKFYVGEDVICTFRSVGHGTYNINIDKFVSILRNVSRRLTPLSIDKRLKWKFREK